MRLRFAPNARGPRLLADAEAREDAGQQILARIAAREFPKRAARGEQVAGDQILRFPARERLQREAERALGKRDRVRLPRIRQMRAFQIGRVAVERELR